MARAARAGFCIGVLTGSGTVDQLLDSGAHLILPDVGYVPSLLKSFQQQQLSTETSPVAREISL
jgi:phosphoglycolate phosphatase-like HAD superfamily hydrolase